MSLQPPEQPPVPHGDASDRTLAVAAAQGHVETMRRNLLDLSTTNRLIHFPHPERARNYVRVVDEVPEVLYDKLRDGKTLRIVDLPNPAGAIAPKRAGKGPRGAAETGSASTPAAIAAGLGIDPSFELPGPAEHVTRKHTDDAVQTLLVRDIYEKTLGKVADVTRTVSEEQGIHTLFAAFGFLEWYEREDSGVARFGPVLLFPLDIERSRKPAGVDYSIGPHDEDAEINIALSERLARDFGMRLPERDEDEGLAAYFDKVRNAITGKPRWRLHRWVTIANFSSARVAMFHDLDSVGWPEGQAPHEHPTFLALTSDRSGEVASQWSDDDEVVAKQADESRALILDADTSQVAAILEAMRDRNLVIKGPPGTGKSQTIANLIAAALDNGLRVLFVAEKMAALEVVKDRLDKAGLGEFCLELHSLKATRKSVLESLARRIELKTTLPTHIDEQRERLAALRLAMNDYVAALNARVGALGTTVHELIWRREQARCRLDGCAAEVEGLRVAGAADVTTPELDRVRLLLDGISQTAAARDAGGWDDATRLWRRIERHDVTEQEATANVTAMRDLVADVQRSVRELFGGSFESLLSYEQVTALHGLAEALPAGLPLDTHLLPKLRDEALRNGLREALKVLARRDELQASLSAAGPVEQLLDASSAIASGTDALSKQADDVTLAALRAQFDAQQASYRETELAIGRVRELLSYVGVQDTDSAASVLALRDALVVLGSVPAEVPRLLRQAPRAMTTDVLPALVKLAEEGQALKATRDRLDRRLNLREGYEELQARGEQYAIAVGRPRWFAWLFGSFWAARRLHARIARARAASWKELVSDLGEAWRFTLERARFEARDDARVLAGDAHRGIDTDYALIARASKWAEDVRRELARMHPTASVFRELLLRGHLDTLQTLETEARTRDLSLAWALATRVEASGGSPSSVLSAEGDEVRTLTAVVASLLDAGLRPDLRVSEVCKVRGDLVEYRSVTEQIARQQAELAAVGVSDPLDASRRDAYGATLKAADAAMTNGMPLAAVSVLARPDARERVRAQLGAVPDRATVCAAAMHEIGLGEGIERHFSDSLPDAVRVLDAVLAARPLLRSHLQLLRELERTRGTFAESVVALFRRGSLPADRLIAAAEYALCGSLVERACERAPVLRRGHGHELDATRAQFRAIDREILGLNAREIASKLQEKKAPAGISTGRKAEWTELALIKHECSKKVRHISLRQLIERAGTAIRTLKPCVMMSPLSAAQFLPKARKLFDLVVIDEASQMRPEDAVGALVRAPRAVVVGDPKQLPPTSFFRALQASPAEGDEDEGDDEEIDAESILDLGVASFGEPRDLRWHYRSRHPSLIAFSNHHFYENRLKVFPAARGAREDLGVHLVHARGEYASSVNHIEAERVADEVLAHVRRWPNQSLGVVAMNMKQRELILDKLHERKDDVFQRFEELGANGQSFFVKSLENVQGDERDVILVSMTYGPGPGSKRVAQRFGPINGVYGARRLNVLFTRARERMVVFSSLRPEDVIVDEDSSEGLKALRSFLVYAERGELEETTRNEGSTESPFEDAVREVLSAAGFETDPQVGVQGFFIDLGVKRGDRPGYLCGVECDGAAYHSQRSARDRDRLRQEILEAQGWRIVRVWSTDWFRNPLAARARLLEQVRACAAAVVPSYAPPRAPEESARPPSAE